jgi:hypothetical protein
MLATLLVGPGKPKLVQISRPPSNASPRDSRVEPPVAPPQTPIQYHREISAFSPYDTPYDGVNQDANVPTTHDGSTTPVPGPSFSSISLVPPPLSFMTRTDSYQSSSTAFSNTIQHLQNQADPFGCPPEPTPSTICSSSSCIAALPGSQKEYPQPNPEYRYNMVPTPSRDSSPTLSTRSYPSTSTRCNTTQPNLVNILAAISSAINTFSLCSSFSSLRALTTLHLSSPAVLDLRCPQIPDSKYITILSKIFPSISTNARRKREGETQLSALAAWILVDLYLCKAIATLKTQWQHDHYSPVRPSNWATVIPSKEPQQQQSSYRYTSLINQSNSSLNRIPTKARDLLGITTTPQHQNTSSSAMNSQQHTTALLHRAIAVQQSVSVVGQKIVEALRGKGGFDEDVWRCVKVLVEVVEESGWLQQGWGQEGEKMLDGERDSGWV